MPLFGTSYEMFGSFFSHVNFAIVSHVPFIKILRPDFFYVRRAIYFYCIEISIVDYVISVFFSIALVCFETAQRAKKAMPPS